MPWPRANGIWLISPPEDPAKNNIRRATPSRLAGFNNCLATQQRLITPRIATTVLSSLWMAPTSTTTSCLTHGLLSKWSNQAGSLFGSITEFGRE